MRKKTERVGTLWDFSTSILSQNIKKMQGGPFGEIFFSKKSLAVPKKNAGGPFGENFFRKKSLAVPKKMQGDPLGKFFSKKSLAVPKKMKGGTLWSRPVLYVTRENRKTLLVQFARPNSAIWCNNIL